MVGQQRPGAMEIMLRSMGMGDAMDAAGKLARSGAIEKLIAFADELTELRREVAQLTELRRELVELRRIIQDGASSQPGSGSGAIRSIGRFTATDCGSPRTDNEPSGPITPRRFANDGI